MTTIDGTSRLHSSFLLVVAALDQDQPPVLASALLAAFLSLVRFIRHEFPFVSQANDQARRRNL